MNIINLAYPLSSIVLILLFADTKTKDQNFKISFNTYRLILLINVADVLLTFILSFSIFSK